MKIWWCKIGEVTDLPPRQAVCEAYLKITGKEPTFLFSGWGAELSQVANEKPSEVYVAGTFEIKGGVR